jgi:hypothetical protein
MAAVRAALAVLLLASALFAQSIDYRDGAFRVSGWKPDASATPDDLSAIFAVHTGPADGPPVLGTYFVENDSLGFRPRFPLAAGVRYRAEFHVPGGTPIEASFDGPKKEFEPTTTVQHIYPSGDVLPANQLRLYIQFSASMSLGEWKRHVRLLDSDLKPLTAPFLQTLAELWDPTYHRLTIYFDPGRIKRGLIPNEELGPPLSQGKAYTLVIDREFADGDGIPLKEGVRKSFRVGPAIRKRLNLREWQVTAPRAGTTNPLTIEFPVTMDIGMEEGLFVVGRGPVTGMISVDHNETRWSFTPLEAWKAGEYHVEIDPRLEDVAGNRMDNVFDVDVTERDSSRASTRYSIPFRIN